MARRLQPSRALVHDASEPGSARQWSMHDLETLLAAPAWSVESLLPPPTPAADAPSVSAKQLHHLLRLSALPLPESPNHEAKMLETLSAQLHFVGEMQRADTTGVQPLRAIRDETSIAEREQTITMDTLKDAFAKEKIIGRHYKRIQRDTTPVAADHGEDWPVLASAERKVARYFIVESERPQE
jgi:Asp-tRNA(Asn)/Glu-tRNA(Gln) amidotransferase C subunit